MGATFFSTVTTVARDDDLTVFYLFIGEKIASFGVPVFCFYKPRLVLMAFDLIRNVAYFLLFLVV